VCSLDARETACSQGCSLTTAVVLFPVHTAVTRQWVYVTVCYGGEEWFDLRFGKFLMVINAFTKRRSL
jgi:hypothetical protein